MASITTFPTSDMIRSPTSEQDFPCVLIIWTDIDIARKKFKNYIKDSNL